MMLLARDAHRLGINLGKAFHVGGCVFDRNAAQRCAPQIRQYAFARGAEKIDRNFGEQAVLDIQALRDTVEGESDQRLVDRA